MEGEKRKHGSGGECSGGSCGGAARAKCDSGRSNGTVHLQNAERNPLKTKTQWKAKAIGVQCSCEGQWKQENEGQCSYVPSKMQNFATRENEEDMSANGE